MAAKQINLLSQHLRGDYEANQEIHLSGNLHMGSI